MTDLQLSFEAQFAPWMLFLTAAILIAAAVLFYLRVWRMVNARAFVLLMGLRLLAVFVLLLIFFRPVVSFQKELVNKADVIFLVDSSKSMRVHDYPSQPHRLDMVKKELLGPGGLLSKLARQFNVNVYHFSSSAAALDATTELEGVKPEGEATNIAKAIFAALNRSDPANTAAVVIVTDGNDNAAKDVVDELDEVKVPLYLVGVGTRSREGLNYKDVLITDVKTRPERFLTVNNKALVDVYLKSVGYPSVERTVTVTERDGPERGHAAVVLDSTRDRQKAVVKIVPEKTGKFVFDVVVSGDNEERFKDNNRQSITVHVVDAKIRVLYVDKPRDEYKQLFRTLSRDPNVELLTLVNNRVGSFTQGGNIRDVQFLGFPQDKEQLSTFDVIILGSVKRSYFSARQFEAMREFVRDGKGFVMLGGTESFGVGGYGGTAADEMLPVESGPPEVGEERDMFLPGLSADGRNHAVFAGCQRFFAGQTGIRRDALELQGFNRVKSIRPGATVLATNPSRKDAPVLVIRNFGRGRTAAFTATGTYRWYRLTHLMGEESPYVKFWGQLVRWLSGREAKERAVEPGVTVLLDKDHYDPGEQVQITAHVRDTEGLATDKAIVTGEITGPRGEFARVSVPHSDDGHSRSYGSAFEPPGPGEYKATFIATLDGKELGRTETTFSVGKPSLESEQVDLNEALLQRIVDRDRNARLYCTLVGSGAVMDRLQPLIKLQTEFRQRRLTQAETAGLFILFVGLLSVEWVLRKRRQLL